MAYPFKACVPRTLTAAQSVLAARRAIEINPVNAASRRMAVRTPVGRAGGKRRIALLVANRWPVAGIKLTVRFLDGAKADLRKKILLHMNAWGKTANVQFAQTSGDAMVRIARLDAPESMAGYWSYVGTQILGIRDQDEPTLNLDSFTMSTPESEFHRVVRHEAGHTLGFEHEHMRTGIVKKIDRDKAFKYFDYYYGWTKQDVIDQVLTPLKNSSLMGTAETDPISIMCYQLPASIMRDKQPIEGGKDINPLDFSFAGACYPKKVQTPRAIR
jgi:hypothetical protein